MANQPYNVARSRFVSAGFDWNALNIRLTPWSGAPNFVATDSNISEIIARGVTVQRGSSFVFGGKSIASDGTVRSDTILLPSVSVGADITHFTMNESGGQLIMYIDDAVGLPFTPNGLDMLVTPDWLAGRGWFRA